MDEKKDTEDIAEFGNEISVYVELNVIDCGWC